MSRTHRGQSISLTSQLMEKALERARKHTPVEPTRFASSGPFEGVTLAQHEIEKANENGARFRFEPCSAHHLVTSINRRREHR